ncbi:ribonucleotide reductase large subunit [Vibrio phage 184E37-3b]|nr:ribonucleoside-diphosphate reductase [Vibrio phage 184E37.3a]
MTIKTVIKSDGSKVPFDAEKFNKKTRWAADRKVNWSDISLKALKRLSDNCTTLDIDKAIIDTCVEEFDEKHFMLAGRVLAGTIYKEAFGGFKKVPTLLQHHTNMVNLGYWESLPYSEEDFSKLEEEVDHSKDLKMSYPEIKQINDKYVIRDRVAQRSLESPQFMYMGMAMAVMKRMPEERRMQDVIKYYHYLSDKKICAPTPFMSQLRTPNRGYASCAIFTTHDTAPSLAAGDHIAYMLTCASAGIGSHLKTRSKGAKVRGGTTIHQGKRPYYKMTESAVAANLQNSRGGSATMHVNCLDPEIMEILTWKNKKTATKVRVDGIHYSFGSNNLFAKYVRDGKQWMLVDLADAPELYEAMYSGDQTIFETLYHEYEKSDKPRTYVSARKIAVEALVQGQESGQVYLHSTDELNRHTPIKDKIYSSNL